MGRLAHCATLAHRGGEEARLATFYFGVLTNDLGGNSGKAQMGEERGVARCR